jgi:hypothetical protein
MSYAYWNQYSSAEIAELHGQEDCHDDDQNDDHFESLQQKDDPANLYFDIHPSDFY